MPPRRLRKTGEFMGTFAERQQSFIEGARLPRSKKMVYWPLSSPSIDDMARSGFYYTPTKQHTDCVTCYSCKKQEFDWPVSSEDIKMLDGTIEPPVIRHLKNSPNCAFANVFTPFLQNEHGSIDFDSWKNNETFKDPANEKGYEYRLQTFKQGGWPYNKIPSMEDLAASGFFYSPSSLDDDLTTCLYCGRQLEGWEESDNVDEEHHSKSKNCYIFEFRESQKIKDHSSDGYLESRRSSKLRRSLRRRSRSFSSSFMITNDNELKQVDTDTQNLSSEELTITKETQLPKEAMTEFKNKQSTLVKNENIRDNTKSISTVNILDQSTDNEMEPPNTDDVDEAEKSMLYNNELSMIASNNNDDYEVYDNFGDEQIIYSESELSATKTQINNFGLEEEIINMDENLDLSIKTSGSDDRDEVDIPIAILDDKDDTWFREDLSSTHRGATFFGRAKLSSNRRSNDTSTIHEEKRIMEPSSPLVTKSITDTSPIKPIVSNDLEVIEENIEDHDNNEIREPSVEGDIPNDDNQVDQNDFGVEDGFDYQDVLETKIPQLIESPEVKSNSEDKIELNEVEALKIEGKEKILEEKLMEVDETIKRVEELKREYEMKLKEVEQIRIESDGGNSSKSKKRSKKHKKKHHKRQKRNDSTHKKHESGNEVENQEIIVPKIDDVVKEEVEPRQTENMIEEPSEKERLPIVSQLNHDEDVVMADTADVQQPETEVEQKAEPSENIIKDNLAVESSVSAEISEGKEEAVIANQEDSQIVLKDENTPPNMKRILSTTKLGRTAADGTLIPSDDPLLFGFGSRPPRRRRMFKKIASSSASASASSRPPSSGDDNKENRGALVTNRITTEEAEKVDAPRRVPLQSKDHNIQVPDFDISRQNSAEKKEQLQKTAEDVIKADIIVENEKDKDVVLESEDKSVTQEMETKVETPKESKPDESESVHQNSVIDDDEEIILDNGYFVSSPTHTISKINIFSDTFKSSANKLSRILSRANTSSSTVARVETSEQSMNNSKVNNSSLLKSNNLEAKAPVEPITELNDAIKNVNNAADIMERSRLEEEKNSVVESVVEDNQQNEEPKDGKPDVQEDVQPAEEKSETTLNGKMISIEETDLSAGEVGDDEKDDDNNISDVVGQIDAVVEKEMKTPEEVPMAPITREESKNNIDSVNEDNEEEELSNTRIRSSAAFKLSIYEANDHEGEEEEEHHQQQQQQQNTPQNQMGNSIQFSSALKDQSTPTNMEFITQKSMLRNLEVSPLDHRDIAIEHKSISEYESIKMNKVSSKEDPKASEREKDILMKWEPSNSLTVNKHLEGLSDAQEYLESIMKSDYSTLYDDLDGKLTDFIASIPEEELNMTIGQWIEFTAQQAADEFKKRGQAMIEELKTEHARAIRALEAVESNCII